MVGQAIGSKLIELGHDVSMGSREEGNPKAQEWVKKTGPKASIGTFKDTAVFGELIFNCTAGAHSLEALQQAGEENLSEKILIDVANPLNFSKGMPPTLTICNTTSLGEEIQKAFPNTKVVKAFNTMNASLMVNSSLVSGDHNVLIGGNETSAKSEVINLITSFGWKKENIIDLGDISSARGTEAFLLLWVRLWGALQNPMFNIHIVKG